MYAMQRNRPTRATGDSITAGPARRRAVLMINLGTPENPEVPAVRRYLSEFLADPAVIRLPFGMQWFGGTLARLIAYFRAPSSSEAYKKIWTERGSPLRTITEDQAAALESALPRGWRVFVAMRYGQPTIADTLRQVESEGYHEVVILSMYPQFSWPTTGTALQLVFDYLKTEGEHPDVTTHNSWHDDHGYINAQAQLIAEYAASEGLTSENSYLLFSTHGLPVSYVKRGDPYIEQVKRSVGLVSKRLPWPSHRTSLAYQSRLGPVRWVRPYADEVMAELARDGEKKILVCPISFTADCLETIEELGIRYRKLVDAQGGELFLCPALNTYGPFVTAMKHLVLAGPRPITDQVRDSSAQLAPSKNVATPVNDFESLIMVGVSMGGRIATSQGPALEHSDRSALQSVKRPQCEVPRLLKRIREETEMGDIWLWNTCHRYELFGWLNGAADKRTETIANIRETLFGAPEPADIKVNVLHGLSAWHHLLRTAAGLNSSLPGERDVLEQLRAAHRLAGQAGVGGPFADRLVDEVVSVERKLRESTGWAKVHPDYSYAAMSSRIDNLSTNVRDCRILVIGGSTTSASVLRMLTDRFQVPSRQLTLVYRGHKKGGQIKLLRRAIGHGRRIRVQSYRDRIVFDTIAAADVVVFGVDHDEPILNAERLKEVREGIDRPLTIFDFNVFGSTEGVAVLPNVSVLDSARLEDEANAFANELCNSPDFERAVSEAEEWIFRNAVQPRQRKGNGKRPEVVEPSTPRTRVNERTEGAGDSPKPASITSPRLGSVYELDGRL